MTRKRPQTSIFIYKWRLAAVAAGLLCVFCAVFARLYYLHIERSDRSIEAVDKARKLFDKIPARRGNIVDAKNNLLATSRPVITLGVDPERTQLDAEGLEKLRKLSEILKMEYGELLSICTPYQDAEKIADVKGRLTEQQSERLKIIGINLNMTYEELIRKCLTEPKTELTVERRVEQVKRKGKVFRELSRILGVPQSNIEKNFVSFSPRWKKIADYFSRDLENKSKRSYYNIGKLLSKADKQYGKGIIKEYSLKLTEEFGKKYTTSLLYKIKQFYYIYQLFGVCRIRGISTFLQASCPTFVICAFKFKQVSIARLFGKKFTVVFITFIDIAVNSETFIRSVVGIRCRGTNPVMTFYTEVIVAFTCKVTCTCSTFKQTLSQCDACRYVMF